MRTDFIREPEQLDDLATRWDDLVRRAGAGTFLSHSWISAWWRAFRGVDELRVLVATEGDSLRAAWPLYLRAPRSGPLRARELRVLGDLGGAERSALFLPEEEELAAEAFVEALFAQRDWDVLEAPVVGPRIADALERALSTRGGQLERTETIGRAYVDLPTFGTPDWEACAAQRRPAHVVAGAAYAPANLDVPFALDELHRLMRKEMAAREEAIPADRQAIQFLAEVVPRLHAAGLARIGLVALAGRGAIAADLVLTDNDRAVQLLRGTDPEHAPAGASEQLTFGSLMLAAYRGARRFELADEASGGRLPFARVLRVRMWNVTAVGRIHRGVESLRAWRTTPTGKGASAEGGRRASDRASPFWALDRLRRATPEAVQRAVAKVASYTTLHLYRGELFTRGVLETGDLSLALFTNERFDGLSAADREAFIERLELQEGYCRQKWSRGDTVVVAERNGLPAGILWCARTAVHVPDIAREVRPGPGECYIHDVFVHRDQRGQKVAPAMLDFLARHLRARDVYRAWALIERSNIASIRAFEKAAYTSVADVIYAKMGIASRLLVRPPDPEARQFLGIG